MRRKTKRVVSVVTLIALLSTGVFILATSGSAPDFNITEEERSKAYNLLTNSLENSTFAHKKTYVDFRNEKNVVYNLQDSEVATMSSTVNQENNNYEYTNGDIYTIEYGDSVDYLVTVSTEGLYEIEIDYRVIGNVLTNQTIGVMVNNEYQYVDSETDSVEIIK